MNIRSGFPATSAPAGSTPGRMLGHVASFETVFALFLYSNHFKFFIAGLTPVDETLLFFLLSVPVGAWVVLHRGLYLPGLAAVTAGLLFFAWVGLSWSWSPSPLLPAREVFMLLSGGLWSLLAAALVIAPERERVIRFLTVSAVVGAVIAGAGWVYRSVYGDLVLSEAWRQLGFRGLYQLWGQMSALGGLAALAFATFAPFLSRRQLAFLALAFLALSFVPAAGSRLALLGSAGGIVLLLAFLPARIGRGSLHLSTAHLALPTLLALGLLVLAELASHGIVLSTLERLHAAVATAESEVLRRYDRPNYLATALHLWLSAPVFGVGIMGFAPLGFSSEGPGGHPHNIVLQVLAETGLVGFTLFVLFLWTCWKWASPRRLRTDPLLLAVLVCSSVPWAQALLGESLGLVWPLYAFSGLACLPPPEREGGRPPAAPRAPMPRPPRVLH